MVQMNAEYLELCESLLCRSTLCDIYGNVNGTQRSYLGVKVQQLTTTVLGAESVVKTQITHVHKHKYNMSKGKSVSVSN